MEKTFYFTKEEQDKFTKNPLTLKKSEPFKEVFKILATMQSARLKTSTQENGIPISLMIKGNDGTEGNLGSELATEMLRKFGPMSPKEVANVRINILNKFIEEFSINN